MTDLHNSGIIVLIAFIAFLIVIMLVSYYKNIQYVDSSRARKKLKRKLKLHKLKSKLSKLKRNNKNFH